jgi:hypothetical protein
MDLSSIKKLNYQSIYFVLKILIKNLQKAKKNAIKIIRIKFKKRQLNRMKFEKKNSKQNK